MKDIIEQITIKKDIRNCDTISSAKSTCPVCCSKGLHTSNIRFNFSSKMSHRVFSCPNTECTCIRWKEEVLEELYDTSSIWHSN